MVPIVSRVARQSPGGSRQLLPAPHPGVPAPLPCTTQQAALARSHSVHFPRKHFCGTQCVRASLEIFLHCFMPQIIA